jgi:hypothetical protein
MAIIATLSLLGGVGLTGCNHGPAGLVPVSGKLTLDGGAWPKRGRISFSPVKPTPGHPVLPAMAPVNDDGSFTIKTPDAPGLVPGEYNVAIICNKETGDGKHEGRSAIPDRYCHPQTSGLKATVPEGSGPIVLKFDLTSK